MGTSYGSPAAAGEEGGAQMQQSPPHERTDLPETLRGTLKLTDWVIGTVVDSDAAQACVEALRSAGIADEDMLVESAASALRQLWRATEHERDKSGRRLSRLMQSVAESYTGRTPALHHGYLIEAHMGRTFVGAHDAQGDQIDRIRNILVAHGARSVRLFEPTAVRRLG
jgi:hypothetical protein